jgi:CCR4-NOT transcriptional complex subunit CAF120
MFEHTSLQELYTGSLIAGKGKKLNNIKVIMERTRLKTEDWARVRFGAGTPWRRCWCVIEPPDEKDFQKLQKTIKKRSAYERPPVLKGDIKFYDGKKTKKAMPIATITDAYSAYAIYPQAKPLIDQSTLVKVEGRITIHSQPESKTEGFVFVMPEAHPAVTGFEMMLRWLFPVYDTFGLYGRPRSLIADTLDTRGLMFAMPRQKRYGYLEIIDVAGLIHTDGSKDWSEREWRKQMKELTSRRMEMRRTAPSREGSQLAGRRGPRTSLPSRPGDFRYDDNASVRSTSSIERQNSQSADVGFATPQKTATGPPGGLLHPPAPGYHARAASESVAFASPSRSKQQNDSYIPSRLSTDHEATEAQDEQPPPDKPLPYLNGQMNLEAQQGRDSSDSDRRQYSRGAPSDIRHDLPSAAPTEPVTAPPAFAHHDGDRPQTRPQASPEMRRANNRISTGTLSQMVDASGMRPVNGQAAAAGAVAAWNTKNGGRGEGGPVSGVIETPPRREMTADQDVSRGGVVGGKPSEEGQISNNQAPLNFLQPPPPNKSRSSSAKSITRKALPSHAATSSYLHSITTESGTGASFTATSPGPADANCSRQEKVQTLPDQHSYNDQGGNNEDIDYTPDYPNTRQPTELHESNDKENRPRTGVLKTVGDPTPLMPTREAPTINFGPTASLTPSPGGDQGKSEPPHTNAHRNQYDDTQDQAGSFTKRKGQRSSYLGKSSPVEGSDGRPNVHSRSASYDKRIMAWQPGALIGTGRQSPSPAITPEEFVQRRASANRTPSGYAPQRSRSSGYFGVDRPISGEWSKKKDSPSGPQSRGSSPVMNPQQDYSSRLSAHEQEHIAKMTGSPLITVPRKSENQVGLIGAIHAREQERKNMREGVSGQMVQHAIAQRQQQAQSQGQGPIQAQQAAQAAYGYSQQQQGYQDSRGQLISAATSSPQNSLGQNAQWTGQYAQVQTGHNFPQQNPSQQYNPSYVGYYGQQNGYQG